MRIYTFRCAKKADLFAITDDPAGDNLPLAICNEWVKIGEDDAQPGDHVAGFVSHDLFRDLERQGFHIAVVGVKVTRSHRDVEVGKALTAANGTIGFFRSDRGA